MDPPTSDPVRIGDVIDAILDGLTKPDGPAQDGKEIAPWSERT